MKSQSSGSCGLPVFSIGGRMVSQKQRLLGMTDEERRWRAQFLKDQELLPEEPRFSPEYYRATNNIFTRILKYPGVLLTNVLRPALGTRAPVFVGMGTRVFQYMVLLMCITYYFKYHGNNWTKRSGFLLVKAQPAYLPGDQEYPDFYKKKPYEYYDVGFSQSPLCPFNKDK